MFTNKKKTLLPIVLVIIVIVGANLLLYFSFDNKDSNPEIKLDSLYQNRWLEKQDSVHGPITIEGNSHGTVYCITNDSFRFMINSLNEEYNPKHVSKIIQSGDTIEKAHDEEYYFVIHENKRYKFHIDRYIFKKGLSAPRNPDSIIKPKTIDRN